MPRIKQIRAKGTCADCGKTMLKSSLFCHFNICSAKLQRSKKSFKCTYKDCLSKFSTLVYLRAHERRFHKSECLTVRCGRDGCTAMVRREALDKHIDIVHKRCHKIECPKCGRTIRKSYLRTHLNTNCVGCADELEKKFMCRSEGCGVLFTNNESRKAHERGTHGPDESCKYPNCSYFGKYLASHTSFVHKRRVKKVCENCGSVVKMTSFKNHQIICSNRYKEKTFPCHQETCDLMFATILQRDVHLNTHKPKVTCPREDCNVEMSANNLTTHIKMVHEQMQWSLMSKCQNCDRTYIYKPDLIKHVRREHPEELERYKAPKKFTSNEI